MDCESVWLRRGTSVASSSAVARAKNPWSASSKARF
jgi:hypothetical protein